MDEGTIETQNPKSCLYWCFIEFIRLEIQSVMIVFSTTCELLPIYEYLLSDLHHPIPKVNVQYIQTGVWLWGVGGGVELCCRP